ncbi:hypothetical protein BCR42DRAFT_420548 [Absidia repens]|uniref:Transcription factor domain-containing protein n=1 Tax=Absidia repens TaxID=90262 RepID=A0A1X2I9W6_9FUNG|nr:hypothetical protein BCR42DRAFT_420548 [Absidia repens]
MDTNITSVSELLALMQHATSYFRFQQQQQQQQQQQPLFYVPSRVGQQQQQLTVTLGAMRFEKALRDMFTSTLSSSPSAAAAATPSLQSPAPAPPPAMDYLTLTSLKHQLIDIYFICPHLHNPVLVAPYYQNYMHQHVDDMMSWAAAAYVAYSRSCHHIAGLATDLTTVGEMCRLEAKRLLDQALFLGDDDADKDDNDNDNDNDNNGDDHDRSSAQALYYVSWIFTAYLLAQLSLMTLRNKEARIYADTCWRMAIQQKDRYVPMLPSRHSTAMTDQEEPIHTVHAESWRRLYMVARFLDIGLNLVHDHRINVAQLASHAVTIGFPQALTQEKQQQQQQQSPLYEAILAFSQLCKLYHVAFMGYGERVSVLAFRLFMGKLASVGSQDVSAMEERYVAFWYGLDAADRVGLAPLDYVQMDRVHQCVSARALRVNVAYYMGIMLTVLRIMPNPESVDMVAGTMMMMGEDYGSERALLVVSVCCDAIIKIYQVLQVRLPCTVELHWLTIVLDTVLLLINAKHPDIRRRAQQGARAAKALFRQCVSARDHHQQHQHQHHPLHADTPESLHTCSSSSNSTTTTMTTTAATTASSPSLTHSPLPLPTSSKSTSPPPPSSSSSSASPHTTTYQALLAQQMDAHLASKDAYYYL